MTYRDINKKKVANTKQGTIQDTKLLLFKPILDNLFLESKTHTRIFFYFLFIIKKY